MNHRKSFRTLLYVDAWVCVCVYIYICVCMCVLVHIFMRKVYVYMCVNIYMRVYSYIFACTCIGEYVRVCVWAHVNVCEGPYHPLRFGRRGCCFYKSENTESDWRHPTGWLISNFLMALTGDIIFLSQCRLLWCTSTVVLSCTPTLCTYC